MAVSSVLGPRPSLCDHLGAITSKAPEFESPDYSGKAPNCNDPAAKT